MKHLTQQEQSFSQLGALSWQCVIKEGWLLEHAEIAFNMVTVTASVGRNHLGRKKKKDPRHKRANIKEYVVKKKYTMNRMCYFYLKLLPLALSGWHSSATEGALAQETEGITVF